MSKAILQCIQLVFGAVFFMATCFGKMPIRLVLTAGCAAISRYRLRAHVVRIWYLRFRLQEFVFPVALVF